MMITQWIRRIGLILIIATSVSYAKNGKEMAVKESNPICTTNECKKIAKMYIDGMNEKADPCDNFFEYACGNWPNLHSISKGRDDISVEDLMYLEMFTKLKALLEESKKSADEEIERAKKVYKACTLGRHFYERTIAKTIRADMNSIGNIPIFMPALQKLPNEIKWAMINQQYAKLTGEMSFFDIVYTYAKDDVKPALKLTYPESLYGTVIPSKLWTDINQERYMKFLVTLITNIKFNSTNVSEDSITRDVKDVINFRQGIMKVIADEKNLNTKSEKTKLGELQKWYNKLINGNANAEFDWLEQIRSLYKDEWAKEIKKDTVLDAPMTYLEKLGDFLTKQSKEIIANHIHIYFAERALDFNDELQQLLLTAVNNEFGHSSGTFRYEKLRWKKCIRLHNMPAVLETMYLNSDAFSLDIKSAIEKMFEETKKIVQTQIEESSWLNDEAKRKSKTKINKMTAWIGYPPWQKDPALKNSPIYEKGIQVLDINAKYIKYQNRIYVAAPYLKPPIYDTNWPYVLYYGNSYSMLGHEMYHAFTDDAIDINEKGKKNSTWWPEDMRNRMLERRTCFTELYDKHRKHAFKNLSVDYEPEITQGEDIADSMGLKAAYDGFKMHFIQSGGNCAVPLGFEKKWNKGICEKLFFLSYANTFCANMNERYIIMQLQMTHNVPIMRINVPLANMEEFNSAFECKKEVQLNASKKCDLWK